MSKYIDGFVIPVPKANMAEYKDPRMKEICPAVNGVFDVKRMIFGGYQVIVDAAKSTEAARS